MDPQENSTGLTKGKGGCLVNRGCALCACCCWYSRMRSDLGKAANEEEDLGSTPRLRASARTCKRDVMDGKVSAS
eukprot:1154726-Pelagomonas_calceolata.AAC.3